MSNGTSVMELREKPRFVSFGAGDFVEGVLLQMERVNVGNPPKAAVRYTVQQDDGEFVSFLGTWELNTKLRPTDRGHRVEIKCEGEDTMIRKGDNHMKVFEVKVSKEPARKPLTPVAGDGTEITDDDLPF